MKIDVKVDTAKLDRLLADFPAALARAQRQALMDIGGEVASQAQMAFRTPKMRPAEWAPRKPSKRDDGHPLLIKSGVLRQSIESKLRGEHTVVVGTDKKYAGYQQFGTKHMPARPFMPIDANGNLLPRMQRKIIRLANDALAKELRRIGLQ